MFRGAGYVVRRKRNRGSRRGGGGRLIARTASDQNHTLQNLLGAQELPSVRALRTPLVGLRSMVKRVDLTSAVNTEGCRVAEILAWVDTLAERHCLALPARIRTPLPIFPPVFPTGVTRAVQLLPLPETKHQPALYRRMLAAIKRHPAHPWSKLIRRWLNSPAQRQVTQIYPPTCLQEAHAFPKSPWEPSRPLRSPNCRC